MSTPAGVRRVVRRRARERCEYCGSPEEYSVDPFSIEHIIPQARGASDEADYLALAYQRCNNGKATAVTALDLRDGVRAPLFNPRSDVWEEHYVMNDDLTLMIGLTPTGRATINRLLLNRDGVVNLRKLLQRVANNDSA
jgi:cytochrome c1